MKFSLAYSEVVEENGLKDLGEECSSGVQESKEILKLCENLKSKNDDTFSISYSEETAQREFILDAPHLISPGGKLPLLFEIRDADGLGFAYSFYSVNLIDKNNDNLIVHTFSLEELGLPVVGTCFGTPYTTVDSHTWYKVVYIDPDEIGLTRDKNNKIVFSAEFDGSICGSDGDATPDNNNGILSVKLDSPSLPKLPNWLCGDVHYHSSYTDTKFVASLKGEFGAPLNATFSIVDILGLDWVTVTDHSNSFSRHKDDELSWGNFKNDCSLYNKCLVGTEINCDYSQAWWDVGLSGNHLLAYNYNNYIEDNFVDILSPNNPSCEIMVSNVIGQGGFVYAAHPESTMDPFGAIVSKWHNYSLPFHGLQVWNEDIADIEKGSIRTQALEDGLKEWRNLLLTGRKIFISAGTDSHGDFNDKFGREYTCVHVPSYSRQNIFNGLKNGNSFISNNGAIKFEINNKMVGESLQVPISTQIPIQIQYNLVNSCYANISKGEIGGIEETLLYPNIYLPSGQLSSITRYDTPIVDSYYRVECASQDGKSRVYTNPIWVNVLEPTCNDDVKNGDETGVDCGGNCHNSSILEVCNNLDDDKDCQMDENLTRQCGINNTGICRLGAETCQTGQWIGCNATLPQNETCDGRDEDCDGSTDEDFPNFGQQCFGGIGECQAEGVYLCKDDGSGTLCSAIPKKPEEESCDGKDNDCDGIIDGNLTMSCGSGNCTGIQNCTNGNWSSCSSYQKDCGICAICDAIGQCSVYDGTQDSDCSQWNLVGISNCMNNPDNNPFTLDYAIPFYSECSAINQCTTGIYSYTHSCNVTACGADCEKNENCNPTDCDYLNGCYQGVYRNYQDVANTCLGNCSCTENICGGYSFLSTDIDGDSYDIECGNDCNDTSPSINPSAVELCNGIDDNCNGLIDEGLSNITCGLGICEHSIESCVNGQQQICYPYQGAKTEVCNGIDDNCDGATDENGDSLCNNTLFCDGIETCAGLAGCQTGLPIDCSWNNLPTIETCYNNPDTNPFTWDYSQQFVSICDESIDTCTQGAVSLNHTCDVAKCNAECDSANNCKATECDNLDRCYNGIYRNYTDVNNNCLSDCSCESNTCNNYTTEVDKDGDGYSLSCGDCNDLDPSINPGASEICDNGVDEDCNGQAEQCPQGYTIYSPLTNKYSDDRVPINLTLVRQVPYLKYADYGEDRPSNRTLCTRCMEYGYNKSKTISLDDGYHNITIFSSDGLINQVIPLFVDSAVPRISGQEPGNNDYCNGHFNVKYTEFYPINFKLYYGTDSIEKQDCPSGRNQECEFNVSLRKYENETITFFFEVQDNFNTTAYKRNHTCLVDTIPPHFTYLNWSWNSTRRELTLNITLDDKAERITYIDNLDARPRYRTLCSNCGEYGSSRVRKIRFAEGPHNLTMMAVDEAGNTYSEEVYFEVI